MEIKLQQRLDLKGPASHGNCTYNVSLEHTIYQQVCPGSFLPGHQMSCLWFVDQPASYQAFYE